MKGYEYCGIIFISVLQGSKGNFLFYVTSHANKLGMLFTTMAVYAAHKIITIDKLSLDINFAMRCQPATDHF